MKKEIAIVALGELLIDFTEAGISKNGMKLFEQNPGGAPANLLTVASHMGYRTSFIGKIGTDMHGDFLKKTLQNEGIDTGALVEDERYFTTLAFVEIDENGERNFSFARKPGADTQLEVSDLDQKLLSDCRIFHFGSLSLTQEPSRGTTLEAVRIAKEAGALISYDPNYRASLWADTETAVAQMKAAIPLADVMKVSDEESLLLTGAGDYDEAADRLLESGLKLVAITLGSKGVLIAMPESRQTVGGFAVDAVDTTGAGDSFWGGFLSCYLGLEKEITELTGEEMCRCAITGNAVAGLCVQKRGGIPAIPTQEAIEEFIRERTDR